MTSIQAAPKGTPVWRAEATETPSVHGRVGPAWRRLFEALDEFDASGRRRLDVGDRRLLGSLLRALPADEPWLEGVASFSETGYARNRLRAGRNYEALIMCWRSGQRSPIHDHAGSHCAVRVLRGVAAETIFRRTPCGQLIAEESHACRAGDVCVSDDEDTHQIANVQGPREDLVTLHIYFPPLREMHTFPVTDAWGALDLDAAGPEGSEAP